MSALPWAVGIATIVATGFLLVHHPGATPSASVSAAEETSTQIDDIRVALDASSPARSIEVQSDPRPATESPTPARAPGPSGLTVSLSGQLPTPFAVPRSSPYSARPLIPDPVLAERIAQIADGHTGKLGVAIEDLESGRGLLIDPDTEYHAASLFKLSVMYEVFKQRELGALSFDETLVLTAREASYDLGTLDRPAGSTIGLGEALERMITISDNSSAILLTDRVGAGNINQDLRGMGLVHTRLVEDDLVTSPGDMLQFLEMLARGQGVNAKASADMVQLMARQRVNDRIPRLLPSNAIIAHKTGNLPGVVNDVGIVYTPDATFIVAVLEDGTSNETRAAQITADIAAAAYDYFRQGDFPDVTFPTPGPTSPPPPTPVPVPTAEPSPTTVAETPTETRVPRSPTMTDLPPTDLPTSTATVIPTPTVSAFAATPQAILPAILPTPIPGPSALPARRPGAAPQR